MASMNYFLNKVLPVNSEVLVHLKNIGSPDLGIETDKYHWYMDHNLFFSLIYYLYKFIINPLWPLENFYFILARVFHWANSIKQYLFDSVAMAIVH